MKITVIGVGKMGGAIAKTALSKKNRVCVCDSDRAKMKQYVRMGALFESEPKAAAKRSDMVIIAVKPKHVSELLGSIRTECSEKIVLSIAAGIRTKTLANMLGKTTRIARAIPNLPLMVGAGVTSYCLGRGATKKDEQNLVGLFARPGECVRMKEDLMDAATVVGSSGPAFFAMVIEAMASSGAKQGLPRADALKLAAGACVGAGKMVLEAKKEPVEFAGMVATPGGITAEGLESLAKAGVWKAFGKAVSRAVKKSKAIGKAKGK